MKRRKNLRRESKRRPENRRFLIYCEDRYAGRQYIDELRRQLNSIPIVIKIGPGCGEPLSLVREAIAHKDRASVSAADKYTEYDEVWCVIDVEAPSPHPGLEDALREAKQAAVNVALANPCFELWLLLHFKDVTRTLTTKEAQIALQRDKQCGYTVKEKQIRGDVFMDRRGEAGDRALRIRGERDNPLTTNPWTNIDILEKVLSDPSLESRTGTVRRCVPTEVVVRG